MNLDSQPGGTAGPNTDDRETASLFDPTAAYVLQPPTPITEPADRTLRFRVVDSAAGRTSMIWSVVGSGNHDDVYVAQRSQMHMLKLSMHESGVWRLAYTEQWAAVNLATGVDRVLRRWSAPADAVPGWKRACAVQIPVSSLTTVQSAGRRRQVSDWEAPKPSWGLRFDILLGEPQASALTISGVAGNVGLIRLASGRLVGIAAMQVQIGAMAAAQLDGLRRAIGASIPAGVEPNEPRWTFGQDLADDTPVLIDLGLPTR